MPKKILTPEQQRYIVTRLACYELPSQVRSDLDEEHGVWLSVNAISHYDATKDQGHDLSAELRELFFETRRLFQEKTAAVPISNKMYRLTMLQKLADRAMNDGDTRVALAALAQAAREMGGCYERSPRQVSRTMNVSPSEYSATSPYDKVPDSTETWKYNVMRCPDPPTDRPDPPADRPSSTAAPATSNAQALVTSTAGEAALLRDSKPAPDKACSFHNDEIANILQPNGGPVTESELRAGLGNELFGLLKNAGMVTTDKRS